MYGFSLLNQNGDCLLEGQFLFVRKCTDEFRFCRSYGFHSHTVTILPFERRKMIVWLLDLIWVNLPYCYGHLIF